MSALADRLAVSKLVLHPVKTKIVYCKDANRRGDFPIISLDFLGFQFRARTTIWNGKAAHGFMPPASPKALTATSRTVRRWSLHHRSDKSLQELAEMYNPCIRGWITYYSHFYKTRLRPALKRIDTYVIRWARRKFKRMRHQTKGARDWLDRLHRANPSSSPTGHYVMATAEHREPCESRGSCTVAFFSGSYHQRLYTLATPFVTPDRWFNTASITCGATPRNICGFRILDFGILGDWGLFRDRIGSLYIFGWCRSAATPSKG
jgi:hypothetical protein